MLHMEGAIFCKIYTIHANVNESFIFYHDNERQLAEVGLASASIGKEKKKYSFNRG